MPIRRAFGDDQIIRNSEYSRLAARKSVARLRKNLPRMDKETALQAHRMIRYLRRRYELHEAVPE